MAEAPAKPESAVRRWLMRAALAAPFLLAITGFFFRYELSYFIMMRRARADPSDEAACAWIVENSRTPIRDIATLATKNGAVHLPCLTCALDDRLDVLLAVSPDELDWFRELARSQSETIRSRALHCLYKFGFPGAPGEFRKALGDRSEDVVLTALSCASAFRYADDAEWVAAVLRLTGHPDDNVRGRAWETLGASKKAVLLPKFLAALEGATPKEACHVLEGMGLLAAPAALPAVRRHLDHDNTAVAIAARRALCNLGTAEDIETLIGMMGEPDRVPDDSGAVERPLLVWRPEPLWELTGRKASGSPAEWRTWWERNRDTYDLDEAVKEALLDQKRRAWACHRIRTRNMQHLIPYLRETFPEGERPYGITGLFVWFGDTRAALSYVEFFETCGDGWELLYALPGLQQATLMDFFTDTEAWREWLEARRPNFRECRKGQE